VGPRCSAMSRPDVQQPLANCLRQVAEAERLLSRSRAALSEICQIEDPLSVEDDRAGSSVSLASVGVGHSDGTQESKVTGDVNLPKPRIGIQRDHWDGAQKYYPSPPPADQLRPRPPQHPPDHGDSPMACSVQHPIFDQVVLDLLCDPGHKRHSGTSRQHMGSTTTRKLSSNKGFIVRAFPNSSESLIECNYASRYDFTFRSKVGRYLSRNLSPPVMHPEAKNRVIWLAIGFTFIIYEAYMIPYYLSFGMPSLTTLQVLAGMINFYFMADVILTFFTAYWDNESKLVTSKRLIAWNYVKGWLWWDVLTATPWDWLATSSGATAELKNFRFLRMARMMRLARLLRMAKLKKMMEHLNRLIEASPVIVFLVGLTQLVSCLTMLTHWAACMWYAIGAQNPGTSWISIHLPAYTKQDEMYTWSIYFAMATMTTVGYGDISPTNWDECVFTLAMLAIACFVFAVLMGVLTDMICNLSKHKHTVSEKKMTLMRYMQWRLVPRDLALAIRQHLLFLWETNRDYDSYEKDLKKHLPPVLRTSLCHHVYSRVLVSLPFLAWMQDYDACLKALSSKVRSTFVEYGDEIFRVGQTNVTVHVLVTGTVWVTRNSKLSKGPMAQVQNSTSLVGSQKSLLPRRDLSRRKSGMSRPKILFRDKSKGTSPKAKANPDDVFNNDTRAPYFHARLFLENLNNREDHAARLVQQRWRRHRKDTERVSASWHEGCLSPPNTLEDGLLGQDGTNWSACLTRMQSKLVEAPAYFGESCLWVPMEQWDTALPDKYAYTAKCESRGEIVSIPRDAVREVITEFEHVLPRRFEFFRQEVMAGTKKNFGDLMTRTGSRLGSKSFAMSPRASSKKTGSERLSDSRDGVGGTSLLPLIPSPTIHNKQVEDDMSTTPPDNQGGRKEDWTPPGTPFCEAS